MASAALLLRLSVASGFGGAKPLLRPVRARPRPFSASFARCAALEPPDVSRLAATARISITQEEVEEFGPKIRQVIDWFGQLQAVNLETIEPSFRAASEVSISQREDLPETFENREAMIEAVPSFEDAYIKVPKVLNKD